MGMEIEQIIDEVEEAEQTLKKYREILDEYYCIIDKKKYSKIEKISSKYFNELLEKDDCYMELGGMKYAIVPIGTRYINYDKRQEITFWGIVVHNVGRVATLMTDGTVEIDAEEGAKILELLRIPRGKNLIAKMERAKRIMEILDVAIEKWHECFTKYVNEVKSMMEALGVFEEVMAAELERDE